jgi:hypothetical protein
MDIAAGITNTHLKIGVCLVLLRGGMNPNGINTDCVFLVLRLG